MPAYCEPRNLQLKQPQSSQARCYCVDQDGSATQFCTRPNLTGNLPHKRILDRPAR